jgi:CxxC-x17-CxxC domain-containing protein
MDSQNNDKKMFEGNWTCSGCGAQITQLPFQPDEGRADSLKCLDCFKKNKPERGERKMFEGNWSCADCGKEITQMPFEPSGDRPIKCFDCFKGSR